MAGQIKNLEGKAMSIYYYKRNVLDDLVSFIQENFEVSPETTEAEENEILSAAIHSDDVTGNDSGSYTFDAYLAETYLAHNLDLLIEACDFFGEDLGEVLRCGAEDCDVAIRCYLVYEVLQEALEIVRDINSQVVAIGTVHGSAVTWNRETECVEINGFTISGIKTREGAVKCAKQYIADFREKKGE